ncbi:unnamed protein product [Urochloa humidicola]
MRPQSKSPETLTCHSPARRSLYFRRSSPPDQLLLKSTLNSLSVLSSLRPWTVQLIGGIRVDFSKRVDLTVVRPVVRLHYSQGAWNCEEPH